MHILIDGYNVIGIFHKDMERAREALIDEMVDYRKLSGHDISVVFDGYRNGMSSQKVSFKGHVRIIYSRLGERADDVIKKSVSDERREWVVVTADRDIADHAWAFGSVPVPPERFMDIVSRRLREMPGSGPAAGEVDEDDDRGRKGNPFRPSRREKALRRILSKL